MLAFLDPQLDPLGNAGHDLDVVATEPQLLGHQAGDGAAQDGLGTQRRVLLPEGQGPGGGGHREQSVIQGPRRNHRPPDSNLYRGDLPGRREEVIL